MLNRFTITAIGTDDFQNSHTNGRSAIVCHSNFGYELAYTAPNVSLRTARNITLHIMLLQVLACVCCRYYLAYCSGY